MAASEITVTITLEDLAKRIVGAFIARVEYEEWSCRLIGIARDDDEDFPWRPTDGDYLMIRLPPAPEKHPSDA